MEIDKLGQLEAEGQRHPSRAQPLRSRGWRSTRGWTVSYAAATSAIYGRESGDRQPPAGFAGYGLGNLYGLEGGDRLDRKLTTSTISRVEIDASPTPQRRTSTALRMKVDNESVVQTPALPHML
jgi:hypothetical protein